MTRERFTDESFDQLMTAWLDERAHGPAADPVLDAALARTTRTRPLPVWLVPERWLPRQLTARLQPLPRLAPILLLIGLLLALAVAIFVVGSQRRLPPPFGLAAPGSVAFVADGHLWTTNRDGSNRLQLTSDQRIDGFPTFSRDGTRIAFMRLPTANSKPNWKEWGDVMVADADGGHPILLDAMVHSPSPMTWSADGRFLVYSRTVGDFDQVFIAATDGSSTRQVTAGPLSSWAPVLSPDGRTIAFVKGDPVVGVYVIQIDRTGEHRITSGSMNGFDVAEWSPDATTLLFGAGDSDQGREDLFLVGLDGKPEVRIVGNPGNDSGPTWAPDGRSIAYLNALVGGKTRVMVAGPDGSDPIAISDPGDWSHPYWSPDARNVLAVDGRLGGGQPIVAILDPLGTSPASSFALPGALGDGPEPMAWQRRAAP
jgi:Tol biopolymer transport system component